ncbi:MAG: KTSC domain-containing protein [Caulobacterales bacterium]|nr:KTSC domain-containing protein [Caulobacterales bacterium]
MPSTVIRTFSYDPDARQLHITFVSGRRYRYEAVPRATYEAMRRAHSKGEFFNRRIRNAFPAAPEA